MIIDELQMNQMHGYHFIILLWSSTEL